MDSSIRRGVAGSYNAPSNTARITGVKLVNAAGLVSVPHADGQSAYGFHYLNCVSAVRELRPINWGRSRPLHDG